MHKRVLTLVVFAVLAGVIAAPALAQVRPASGLLPDGDTRPVIVSVALEAPQRHNDLLEADLTIDAYDNDGISRYEYRWNWATFGAVRTTSAVNPTVSYVGTTPDTNYALQIRAVDLNGWESEWYAVASGATPSVPNIIVAGDSIASGYRRQWFTGDATCTDAGYSYGSTVVTQVAASLPAPWAPKYTNIAWPGASVGDMLNGGSDSCGVGYRAQVDQIEALASDDTWNIVVITAGINSTNWTDVVVDLTKGTVLSLTERGDTDVCRIAVRDRWDIGQRRSFITSGTAEVTETLSATTNAQVYWTSYYDITDTELAPFWRPVGSECADEMGYALSELHSALRAGLSDDVTWVDIDRSVTTQRWAGWPHPNTEGHRRIGLEIAQAIVG
ncbi:MAG: hypothetical protein BMS9Abin20_0673 [Acidimicrobiia bacterium]|nr:MAG: hypothetical protein BMS9Abin20_0673 [Acidimicrobiia bacterium]